MLHEAAAPTRHATTRVYAIGRRSAAEVKIGVSSDVDARLRAIQAYHGDELVILLDIAGGRTDERALHERFAHHRKRGEWFHDCPEIRAWLASVRGGE